MKIRIALPFLTAAAAAGIALALTAPASAPAAGGACTPDASWPSARADLQSQVLALVNAHRASLGLGALSTNAPLQASAQWKAQHMAAYNYMAHDDPAPPIARSWSQRIAACGYTSAAGENIARWYPTAAAVVDAWLSDAPHRANIEGAWTVTGIGAATSASGVVYWVEDFGVGGAAPPPPPPTTTSPPPPPPPPTTTTASPPPPAHTTTGTTTTKAPAKPKSRPLCVVPGVHGRTVAAARNRVRRAGCAVRVVAVRTKRVARGHVAWQSPRARVRMPRGSLVTLAVRH